MLHTDERSTRGSGAGFSLAELLVVIAIVAIALGITLPLLSSARTKARQIGCAANLRSIYSALCSYAAESHGWVPRDCVHEDREGTSFEIIAVQRMGFSNVLDSDLAKIQVLRCPEHPFADQIPGCYVSNAFAFIDDDEPPRHYSTIRSQLSAIRNSSNVIYLVDIIDHFDPPERQREDLIVDAVAHDVWLPGLIGKNGWPRRVADSRHGRRVNALMFDGSVASLQGEQHDLRRYDDGRRGTTGRYLYDLTVLHP